MDPITIAILGISAAVVAAIATYKYIQKKNGEIEAMRAVLETHSHAYAFDPCDKATIERVHNYLEMRFGDNYEAAFSTYQSLEEKKAFFQNIAMELATQMQVDLDSITITSIDDYTRGFTAEDGRNVVINEVLLISDPKQAVKTLCHELRHCMQFQAINDNKWGFSPDRIAAWIYSFQRYSEAQGVYWAYFNTIVEVDANKFASSVIDNN